MSFNNGTLTDVERQEMIQGMAAEINAYLARRITDTPEFPVLSRSGTVRRWPQENDHADDGDTQSSKAEPGQPTPKGDLEADTLAYSTDHFKFAYGINELEGLELSEALPIYEKLLNKATHQVLADLERELIMVLKGNGTAADNSDVQNETLASDEKLDNYTGANHDPLGLIEKMKRATGGSRVVLGENVAFALQKAPDVIGAVAGESSTDTSRVGFEALVAFFRKQFGITDTIIGVQRYHDGAETWDFQRAHMHDDIFYMDDGQNLLRVPFQELTSDEYTDDDREKDYVRAKGTWDIVRRFNQNSYAIKDPLS